MYSVYFDGIKQDGVDILNIMNIMQTSIVREGDIDSDVQILREKSDAVLSFTGDSYKYVSSILKSNPCAVIKVKIEHVCGYSYNGTISIAGMERDLKTCICRSDIKDASFSAYINGYISTNVSLYNFKTKNCEELKSIVSEFNMPYDVTNPSLYYKIKAFDVLDVFKFMIAYYTDNKIEVVSDFLTDNKYAITTGYNMHNRGFSIKEKYPEISFSQLFKELRKKIRIYMGIEYNSGGTPYLRIENESYFFSDTELFNMDDIPYNATQSYDIRRTFNQINIGSELTKVKEDGVVTYPQTRYNAWNKETYGKCGTCVGEKDNILDLVSDYVIDSNIIYEALNSSSSEDYVNDDKIFLFNYIDVSGILTGNVTLNTELSNYYYNESLRNENVLINYLEYYRECLEIQRSSSYGFLATKDNQTLNVTDALGYVQNYINWELSDYFLDNQTSLSNVTHDFGAGVDALTIFTCQKDNNYNFKCQALNLYQRYTTPTGFNNVTSNVTYNLYVKVFSDNTFTTVLNTYNTSALAVNSKTNKIDLTITTGNIALVVGNVVCCELTVSYPIGNNTGEVVVFSPDLMSFELIDDTNSCDNITTQENTLPYILKFSHPICFEDYNNANKNKNGYIKIKGSKYWIKELNYKKDGLSTFVLMSNNFLS